MRARAAAAVPDAWCCCWHAPINAHRLPQTHTTNTSTINTNTNQTKPTFATLASFAQDMDFFLHLEMHMRQEHPPLSGRDHLAFRSSYFPVRACVDGDLCGQFPALPAAKQKAIAEELERAPGEVLKKLEDMRNKIM